MTEISERFMVKKVMVEEESRLMNMINHEYKLLEDRLNPNENPDRDFS